MANLDSTDLGGNNENPQVDPKGLLKLVKILGMVLVLLFFALIGGIIWKASKPKPIVKAEDLAVSLGLNAADVKTVNLDGGQVLISTSTEIIVIDVAKKKILLREPLAQ
jgi:hypothetical protein